MPSVSGPEVPNVEVNFPEQMSRSLNLNAQVWI